MPERYSISREAFRALAEEHGGIGGNAVPYTLIGHHMPADLDTPVSALLKIRRGEHSFLLESVERGTQVGRYSFLGTRPHTVLTAKDGTSSVSRANGPAEENAPCADPLARLRELLAERRLVLPAETGTPRFIGGAVGYVGYEVAATLEPVPLAGRDPLRLPDLAFGFYDTVLVFDHVQRTAQALTLAPLVGDADDEYDRAIGRIEEVLLDLQRPATYTRNGLNGHAPPVEAPPEVSSNLTEAEFKAIVEEARERIAAGDIIQVVLSQRFERRTGADPFSIYRALRMVNPSPYMFFLQFGETCLVGASPEMLVRAQGRKVSTHPIAGTRPRGRNTEEDNRLEAELVADEKEQAEHLMLVDLGRNDIGRIARVGSVRVPRFMQVDHYSHVMHLVSEVEGELREGLHPIDVLRACFPAGTVSGAPKVRAMQIISELEQDRRGPYAGAAGYIGYDGNMDTAITIRTVVVRGGVASVQAGAGIVADSVPESEHMETRHKARAMLQAIDLAEEMERDRMSQPAFKEGGILR